jgi:L-lactate dehydrogenase complex protein LldG
MPSSGALLSNQFRDTRKTSVTDTRAKSSAREAILARIATALAPLPANLNPTADWDRLERDYIRTDSLKGPAVIELFEDRLKDYGARIFHSAPAEIRQTIVQVLADRGARRIVVPTGVPSEWLGESVTFVEDLELPCDVLNQLDGVLTTATVAVAATGSIVLQHGPGQGRRAITLIPDYHLCIVRADQIVETVPAAFALIKGTLPTTFISGPSATADIEMTRIKGVHGPRFMDVVLVS